MCFRNVFFFSPVVAVRLLHGFCTPFLKFLASRSSPSASSLETTLFDSSTTDTSHSCFSHYSQHMKTGLRVYPIFFFTEALVYSSVIPLSQIQLPLMIEVVSFDSSVINVAFGFHLNIGPELIQIPNNSKPHCFRQTTKIHVFLKITAHPDIPVHIELYLYCPAGIKKNTCKFQLSILHCHRAQTYLQLSSNGFLSAVLDPSATAV